MRQQNNNKKLPILDKSPSNNTDEYCRRSERIAKLRMKANTNSPSGNAIVDLKSTDATVGEADASDSSGGM